MAYPIAACYFAPRERGFSRCAEAVAQLAISRSGVDPARRSKFRKAEPTTTERHRPSRSQLRATRSLACCTNATGGYDERHIAAPQVSENTLRLANRIGTVSRERPQKRKPLFYWRSEKPIFHWSL